MGKQIQTGFSGLLVSALWELCKYPEPRLSRLSNPWAGCGILGETEVALEAQSYGMEVQISELVSVWLAGGPGTEVGIIWWQV